MGANWETNFLVRPAEPFAKETPKQQQPRKHSDRESSYFATKRQKLKYSFGTGSMFNSDLSDFPLRLTLD